MISCLAHIVSIATQAFILKYSKSKYYNPAEPEAKLPLDQGFVWDEVGLVWTICVKVSNMDLLSWFMIHYWLFTIAN